MVETVLGGTLSFLNDLGMYDVVLPFLLVFTIVFAILEKTKILGTEKSPNHTIDGEAMTVTRKNMNAMTSFVIAFFVVASSQLVAVINEVASQTFLLLLLVILFLMLAGVLKKEGEYELERGWRNFFMGIGIVTITLIFLNSLGWLEEVYDFLVDYWDTDAISAIILLILIIIFIAWITRSPADSRAKRKEKEDKKGDS